ncbi:type IV pilus biogenesis protein PilM [Escherichia coli]|nr:type IV pilus biogenesis protein PilM [Escherichia coli]
MKPMSIILFCMFVIVFIANSSTGTESYDDTMRKMKSSRFLNYVAAFDEYYLYNGSASGDVTQNVVLPVWLPRDNAIRMYINGGYGYVFMPTGSGVLSEILKTTDYSLLVGFTDNASIKTSSGVIPKPSFIPSGYIVYVR